MDMIAAQLPILLVGWVMLGWFAFAAVFLFRQRPPATQVRKMDRRSLIGIALQSIAYALVWSVRRPFPSPLLGLSPVLDIAVAAATAVLVVFSIWLVASAVRTLGKQWSLAARVVEDHQLIVEGPYRIVRHPIYSGMGGMLIATGVALSHPLAIIIALIVFAIGTFNRIRIEERLLTEQFGSAYAAYAAKVPALIPRPWRKPS
jgi:protein-S-isoprenylcysteine O-methyltransferase Ste14